MKKFVQLALAGLSGALCLSAQSPNQGELSMSKCTRDRSIPQCGEDSQSCSSSDQDEGQMKKPRKSAAKTCMEAETEEE